MYPKMYSADKGEFNHFDAEGVSHDKLVTAILIDTTPVLKKCSVSYVCAERLENEELRYFAKESFKLPWVHLSALLRLNEDFEFFSDKATSLVTFVANDYITKAGTNIEYPEVAQDDNLYFEAQEASETVPNQRLSPSKAFMVLKLKEGDNGYGFYPDTIVASFLISGAKVTYKVSWDFFYQLIINPNPRMLLGVDYTFDEELKRLDVIKPSAEHSEHE